MIDFQEYINKGFLKKQRPDFKQVQKQIIRAEKDLSTYTLVVTDDPEWASTIAYQAMLRLGRALLFSYGVLPSDGRQHKTVVEITGLILGPEYKKLIRQFDKFRRKRNIFFYDSIDVKNTTEAQNAFKTAQMLLCEIKKKIALLNPQSIFDF